jgi:mannose-6-phosphate isomerase
MLYPLQFEPLFQQYIWGGRRLGSILHKPIAEQGDFAESWEIVDHHDGQSVVANGPLAGQTLGNLVKEHGAALFGQHESQASFPLLFKFLDCNRNLSVQVHPDDARGALLDPPDLGKTEAWVILAAEPGSCLYAGLKRGFDKEALAREVSRGTTELCLHKFEPQVGDCIFIPAGTVHALGEGLLVAEIQQASNTTYRLFDWNRVGHDGQPRPLHIEAGLEAIDYERGPVDAQQPVVVSEQITELVRCEKFVLERWEFDGTVTLPNDDRFHLLAVLSGELDVQHEFVQRPLSIGKTLLVPACSADLQLVAAEVTTLLHVMLP